MAEELSQTIQEGLTQTLMDLLGIDTKFQETTQVVHKDIQNNQLLLVNSEFEFEKLSTIVQFLIPATTASIVFNTMMGSPNDDISTTIDDDTTDAMGEFVSNVSGSLVTAFNAKEITELGKSKFHIQHKEIIEGNSLESLENIYRFVIDLDEKILTLFIKFDEKFLPFISDITNSKPTEHPEEALPSPQEEEVKLPEKENKQPQEEKMKEKKAENTPNEKEVEDTEEDAQEDEESQNKAKKLKLLIIGVASLLVIVLIVIFSIFIFSPSEEEVKAEIAQTTQDTTNTTEEKKDEIKIEANTTLKKVDFNIKDIDIGRLNSRLAALTKFEILTKEELELQQQEENDRLERLKKEEELMEFAKNNKEEPIEVTPEVVQNKVEETKPENNTQNIPTQNIITPVDTPQQVVVPQEGQQEQTVIATTEETLAQKPEVVAEQKLLFVLTNSIKYTLFKSLVSEINSSSARISMCNDTEGRTTILIGPFEDKTIQEKMNQLIIDSKENISTSLEEYTQEEFNQRCDF